MTDKEKYEMALEGIQEILSSGEDFIKMSRLQLRLQGIFPELAESEDEQHRKWIIEYLYDGLRKSDEQFKDHFKAAIAWVEKQVDQKLKFRIGDTIKKKSTGDIVTICEIDLKNREYRLSNTGFITFKYEYLWELVERKPAEWTAEDEEELKIALNTLEEAGQYSSAKWLKNVCLVSQPKQEWSKEGKQNLKIEGYENLSDYEKIFDDIADKYVRNKNQKGYNQSWYVKERAAEMLYQANKELKKKVNWSEEDEDIRDNIIRDLKRLSGDMVSPNQTYQKEIDWLKSLRPQSQWKPSREQMNGLKEAIEFLGCTKTKREPLQSLYEQLKKLREE